MESSAQDACPFGPDYQVYWNMRYALFSRFDRVRIDRTALYTLVPEAAALHMASRAGGARALDVCSGVGGMSIAFARAGQCVTSVEIDAARVAMAQHNAEVYGVADRIDFRLGDISSTALLTSLPANVDTVFLDPPWGDGPGDYLKRDKTMLADLALAGSDLRLLVDRIPAGEVMLRLPPNFDIGIFAGARSERLAYVTSSGYLRWYFVRMPKQEFTALPDVSCWRHDSPEARRGFTAVAMPPLRASGAPSRQVQGTH